MRFIYLPILSPLTSHDVADPNLECTPYYYAPSGQFVNTFPPIWQPATLLANDSQGQAMWANISASIPTTIQPKGQLNGSTINVTYNGAADPDCCELLLFFYLRRPRRGGAGLFPWMRRRRAALARRQTASLNGTAEELTPGNLTPAKTFSPRLINACFTNRVVGYQMHDAKACGLVGGCV